MGQENWLIQIVLQAQVTICGWLMAIPWLHCQDVEADCLDVLIIFPMGIYTLVLYICICKLNKNPMKKDLYRTTLILHRNLTSLTKLDLRNCGLTHQSCGHLCQALKFLKQLSYIDFTNNKIGPSGR